MLASRPAWSQETRPAAPAEQFAAGTFTLGLEGSYAQYVGEEEQHYTTAGVSVGYMPWDRWEFDLCVRGYYIAQSGENAAGAAVEIMGRTYLYETATYSIYIDGGGGRVWLNAPTPPGGTSYNYTARIGPGIAIRLDDRKYLMTGVRYFHLSNGRVHGTENNPSYNGIEGYVGLLFTF